MERKSLNTLAMALILTAAASTLEAQAVRKPISQRQANQPNQQDLIALRAEVDGRSRPYTLKDPETETIPLRQGERIRVNLVGTVIERNGNGTGRPIHARFSMAARRDQLDIVQTGPTWVVVQGKNVSRGEALPQVLYEITDNYQMKSAWKTGRLTFRVEEGTGSVSDPIVDRDRTRWDLTRNLNDRLWRTIVGQSPSGRAADEDADHIYRMGYKGVMDVAKALAADVGGDYDRLGQDQATEVLGDLYRGLLRRTGSDDELWDRDPGFRGNVDTLRRRGYAEMVSTIVSSEEFRRANEMDRFGSLAGEDDDYDQWRNERGRYAVPR